MDLRRGLQRFFHLHLAGRVARTDDTGPVQRHQVDFGPMQGGNSLRVFDGLPSLKDFGFTSNPPLGSDIFAAFMEGDPNKGVVLAVNHQPSRPKNLPIGDAMLYDVRGVYLWLTAEGPVLDAGGLDVVVRNAKDVTVTASEKVRAEAPVLQCTGDVVADCDGTSISLKALHDAYNSHVHGEVQSGSSNTAGPSPTA